jgi:GTP-binding protein Era
MSFLSGFIAIVGPPNAGKSTLLNRILKAKLAIVSPRPQTTRNRIIGVLHGDDHQMVFMDTPGVHKTQTALHKSMVASALSALYEVDIVLLLIEVGKPDDPDILPILDNLRKSKRPCILLINKIDTRPKEQVLPIISDYSERYPFETIIPVSAIQGDGLTRVLEELRSRLRPGPQYYPAEMKTDQPEAQFISEMIREKIYGYTKKEIPYSSAVTVEKIQDDPKKNLLSISGRIHVETDSQKGILIGKGGRMIKAIGSSARLELEKFFGVRVYLKLAVRVEKHWSKDTKAMRRLGY